jgi:hypothetical protein
MGQFIDTFDRDSDNAITRADGANASSGSGESYSFSTDAAGQSVLTLTFDHQFQVSLHGADYLI